jgi:hypothetical protein
MKCPKCGFEQNSSNNECISCGIIFAKYEKYLNNKTNLPTSSEFINNYNKKGSLSLALKDILFSVNYDFSPVSFIFRTALFISLFILSLKLVFIPLDSDYSMKSFWHLINLPFHEAGHVIFRPFGRFITSLGGTLGQLLVPLICMLTFLFKTRDAFAASFAFWWFGENFIDIAPYINDAKSLTLPLLGGNTGRTSPYGFHDWEFILNESGLIEHYHAIASASLVTGKIIISVSMVWGAYLLYKQFRENL